MEPGSPYPGLRPFEVDEAHLFFGREDQTDDLLQRLHATRFLAVVGPSGCGKSSLVRAGMIASLGAGFMVAAGSRWQIAVLRPESRPMHSLARALVEKTVLGAGAADQDIATGFLEATLRRGPLGVVEALRDTPLPPDTNLLILVDQFEEIFRFEREGGGDEADAFVSLLLETARQREMPIYVVITMRSDFFGNCAIFEGLPEALNESQYLTPRLTREQREAAIVGPARVFGGDVAPDLVNYLLNRMGTDPDQLPVMQHLLMRMWTRRFPGDAGLAVPVGDAPAATTRGERVLTLGDCLAVGGIEHALSDHADEAYRDLDDRQMEIAETMFRLLSERVPGKPDIRHPTAAGEIAEAAGASLAELVAVVEVFRKPGRSFIVPAYPEPIGGKRVLDITHEALIRQWERLRDWTEAEGRAAETLRDLSRTAALWTKGQSALWQSPDLERGLDWRSHSPTAVWAKRYVDNFSEAMAFLAASETARDTRAATDAAARRQQVLRLKIGFATASAVAFLLIGYSIFHHYAYVADNVHYYKDFTKSFGKPVGVDELSTEQTRHRMVSLKLVRKGFRGPVLSVEAVDAAGRCQPNNNVGTYLQDRNDTDSSPSRECRWEFVYDNQGQVVYEKAYNKAGRLLWGYSYAPSQQPTISRSAYYVASDGSPANFKNSKAEMVRFDYSRRGFEKQQMWMDRQKQPQPVKDKAYGRKIEYDEQGHVLKMTSLDAHGRPMNDTAGNASQKISYASGNPIDFKALDKDSNLVTLKDGYCEDRVTYDDNGNDLSHEYFDVKGRPTVNESGIHRVEYDYDRSGYVKLIRYYDIQGKPAASRQGYYKEVMLARDDRGDLLRWEYFGADGQPATDSEGVHEYRATYDLRGFRRSVAYFDRHGRPATAKDGFHRIEWEYDADGNKRSEVYFDRDGKPTRDTDGWSHVTMKYDARGNRTEMANFDANGRPTLTNDGFHIKEMTYDDRGSKIEESYFGEHGEPVMTKTGYHGMKFEYDLRGNQTSLSYFDIKDKLVVGPDGYAQLINTYDDRDNITRWEYGDANGRLTIPDPDTGNRYAIKDQTYDQQDRIIEQTYSDADRRMVNGPDGFAAARRRYFGGKSDTKYVDRAGRPVTVNGCTTIRTSIDPGTGEETETECLDGGGNLTLAAVGAAIVKTKYDAHGNKIETSYYDLHDNLRVSPSTGYAIIRKQYDAHGNEIEEAYFGINKKLMLGPSGYAILQKKYDDRNDATEERYLGVNRELRPGPNGYAIIENEYDDHRDHIEVTFFGPDSKPWVYPKYRYAKQTGKYDDDGNVKEVSNFGEDGNLVVDSEGYAMYRDTYDENGRRTGVAYFGVDKKLRVNPNKGYAIVQWKYDSDGNVIRERYFGSDGKPLAQPGGYASIEYEYDSRGNELAVKYFGTDGKPWEPYGYAVERMIYDAAGNEVGLADFAPDGGPTSAARGFATATQATEIVVRDKAQRLIARCSNADVADFWNAPKGCTGPDGQPVVSHPVVLQVFAQSRAQRVGLQVGDLIKAYDGKPVSSAAQLIDLIAPQNGPPAGKPDRKIEIDLVRGGRPFILTAPPGKLGFMPGLSFVAPDQDKTASGSAQPVRAAGK